MVSITVRLQDDQAQAIDELTEILAAQGRGIKVSRSNALRAIVDKGIAAMRAELGIKGKQPTY